MPLNSTAEAIVCSCTETTYQNKPNLKPCTFVHSMCFLHSAPYAETSLIPHDRRHVPGVSRILRHPRRAVHLTRTADERRLRLRDHAATSTRQVPPRVHLRCIG